jgi:hypothetical protein
MYGVPIIYLSIHCVYIYIYIHACVFTAQWLLAFSSRAPFIYILIVYTYVTVIARGTLSAHQKRQSLIYYYARLRGVYNVYIIDPTHDTYRFRERKRWNNGTHIIYDMHAGQHAARSRLYYYIVRIR